MVNLNDRPIKITEVISKVLENPEPLQTEAVLVLPQKGQVKVLNEVGARIWELIDGKRSIGEIAQLIHGQYEVDQQQAETDIMEFISDLINRELVTFVSS